MIPSADKLKIRIGILVRRRGRVDPLSGQPEGKFTITIKIIARRGGRFDPS